MLQPRLAVAGSGTSRQKSGAHVAGMGGFSALDQLYTAPPASHFEFVDRSWSYQPRGLPMVHPIIVPPVVLQAVPKLQHFLSTPGGILLAFIGLVLIALSLLRTVLGVASFVWTYFLRPAPNLRRYGTWAVVTGATDGIGKAYCVALAKKGINLVLVSRTESKLEACEEELRAKYPIKIKHCAADLCKADDATFSRIEDCLEGVDVGILINNAGMSYDHPDYLDVISDDLVRDLITINTLAPTRLAKIVLPGMKERRRGVIINVGSGIATVTPSGPLLSVYTGTKAYIEAFSQSLDAEYREFGVRVQNHAPMFVATKMSKIRRARLDAPTPDAWAAAALRQIGGDTSITPFWFHGLQCAAIKLAPQWYITSYVLRLHKSFMRAYYRKQARRASDAAHAAAAGLVDSESEEPKKGK